MNYQQIIDEIFTALPMYHKVGSSAYKEGLENIEALAAIAGNPERTLRCIHVAGTNGKGSVTHMLSSFYQEMGKKVGLYTSPHLIDFRERIKINGEMIPKEAVARFFEKFQPEFQKLEPSFFEMTTALAFYYFAEEKVDIAIIEVGLGGRLDATNIITPIASVITNISLEHTQLLGDTLAKIAYEKAGIIKPNVPVIIGKIQSETMPVYRKRADELSAPLHTTEKLSVRTEGAENPRYRRITITDGDVTIGENIRLPLAGDCQLENVATFVRTVQVCEPDRPDLNKLIVKAIDHVLDNTHLMGRWQILDEKPLTICDTGHNSGGFAYIAAQLERMVCRRLHVVIGFVSDKDVDSIIRMLPKKAVYTVVRASVARAMDPQLLADKMTAAGLSVRVSGEGVFETYGKVRDEASPEDVLYIGGSTFVVADFLSGIEKKENL